MKFMLMTMCIAAFVAVFGATMFGVWLFDLILSNLGYWWTVIMLSCLGCLRVILELSKDKTPVAFLKS